MSVAEQRYQAVLAVLSEGRTVKDVAASWGVSRQTLHTWLRRYEADGLEGLPDRSHRPGWCPHQMPASVEALVLEMRRVHRLWGPRRIVFELAKKQVEPVPSESGVYRCLVRAGLIDPSGRRRRGEKWKRWERGQPMELWQMDVVGGFYPASQPKRGQTPMELAVGSYGVPGQVLTENGSGEGGAVPPCDPDEVRH